MEIKIDFVRMFFLIVTGTILSLASCMGFFSSRDEESFFCREPLHGTLEVSYVDQKLHVVACQLNLPELEQRVGQESQSLPEKQNIASLIVNRNLVFPVVAKDRQGRVYGAIYPYSLELTEKNGYAAELLLSLYSGAKKSSASVSQIQVFASRFNWQRLMEELDQIPDKSLLDRELILQKIAAGNFTKKDLKVQKL